VGGKARRSATGGSHPTTVTWTGARSGL
jgi:hypothetical protein